MKMWGITLLAVTTAFSSSAKDPKKLFKKASLQDLSKTKQSSKELPYNSSNIFLDLTPIPFEKVGKLWEMNEKANINSDIFSLTKKLSTGAILFAGLKGSPFQNRFYQSTFKKCDAETAYVLLHGRPLGDSMLECGTPLVFQVGESEKDLPEMSVIPPKDWPKRGFKFNEYTDEAERNYAKMAYILTKQNPKWIIALCCNHDKTDPTLGATPKFFRQMILLPDNEIKLEWVVMNEPGEYGFADSFEMAVEYEEKGCVQIELAGEKIPARKNAPQLYRVFRKDGQWTHADMGTFTLNRSYPANAGGNQLSDTVIERFEITQIGPAEYKRF
jgi:hypothetical protein